MNIIKNELGEIEIDNNNVIKFVRSIFGFENYEKFIVLSDNPTDDIMYLQSIEDEKLHFVIVEPSAVLPNFAPELSEDDLNELQINRKDINELKYMLVAVVPQDVEKSVVNLKSPIVINPRNNLALQAILLNSDYPVRYPLFIK